MRFTIITHAKHKIADDQLFAYEPYVREMNLWLKNVAETLIVAPIDTEDISPIDTKYLGNNIRLNSIPSFNILSLKNTFLSLFRLPVVMIKVFQACYWADHIHLRCPGNIGLLGCFVQILFPNKPKTVKYAGNWDPASKQPWSYRLQKRILSNTFLTKNCKVLVYGEWENQSKNIVPFFTASYYQSDVEEIAEKNLSKTVKCLFVGSFTKGKQPLLSVKAVEALKKNGVNIQLHMYGNGTEYENVMSYVLQNKLDKFVFLHGNQSKEVVKRAFQEAHFLIFLSTSEGWPKVVAEAMFWSCLPIASKVSCVPYMLDNGNRGDLVNWNAQEVTAVIQNYIKDENLFKSKLKRAIKWSQEFTMDKFDQEISKLITQNHGKKA